MISAYVDRFEEEKAVLLLGDEMKKVIFPKEYLPSDVFEGDYLCIEISRDEEQTAVAEDEALELLRNSKG